MSQIENLDRVRQMADEAATNQGCLLYDLEFIGHGANRALRVFIDKDSGPVDIDDCTKVSNGLNELLDADEEIISGGAYNLEVSSPGLERPLKEAWHFQKALGKTIWVKMSESLKEQGFDLGKFKTSKVITAELISASDSELGLKIEDQQVLVSLDKVEKAKTVFEYGAKSGAKR